MLDPFDREINYLRVSVTDRCDFRCVYCMSEQMTFLPKKDLLSLEELERLCGAFIDLGIKKLRITGGEPLVRRDIMSFFKTMGKQLSDDRLHELTLTTNGSLLYKYADDLAQCGIKRVNISIDSLDPIQFQKITRWGKLDQVMRGVEAAKKAGLKIKINTVALKGVNDREIHDLVRWCGDGGYDLCFIEVMPMGDLGEETRFDQYWPLTAVKRELAQQWTLKDSDHKTGGPARYVDVKETGGRIGFITPLTHNFCEQCNRVRVTCTGTLYMCLGQSDMTDLRKPLRQSESNEQLSAAILEAISRKPKGHDFVISRKGQPFVPRHMSTTGG